jgi:hypothetical protein
MSRSRPKNPTESPKATTSVADVPPALAAPPPQFDAEHWSKVRRTTVAAVIERVTHKGEYNEIVLKGGTAFLRKREDIQQLLTANLDVNVEYIAAGPQKLVTGLFVPGVGWAFRMSNDDIAAYTREVFAAEHRRQQALREAMIDCVTDAMLLAMREFGFQVTDATKETQEALEREAARFFATVAIGALEQGPQQ